jgi:hypothetical protein
VCPRSAAGQHGDCSRRLRVLRAWERRLRVHGIPMVQVSSVLLSLRLSRSVGVVAVVAVVVVVVGRSLYVLTNDGLGETRRSARELPSGEFYCTDTHCRCAQRCIHYEMLLRHVLITCHHVSGRSGSSSLCLRRRPSEVVVVASTVPVERVETTSRVVMIDAPFCVPKYPHFPVIFFFPLI